MSLNDYRFRGVWSVRAAAGYPDWWPDIRAVGRPVFRANHAVMTWRGRRALRAYLAG